MRSNTHLAAINLFVTNTLYVLFALFATCSLSAEEIHQPSFTGSENFAARASQAFQTAKTHFQANPTNASAACQLGIAAYDWADFATSKQQRADIAEHGISACRSVIERDPDSAPGHYYLALNLGQLARTRKLSALNIVSQMEAELKIAIRLDSNLDYGGPDRSLGLLYLEAPGWPTSIGSKAKAKLHLLHAAKIAPNYPENLLNLAEAYLKWGDKNAAARELKQLDDLWPAAKKEFTGERWEPNWADWQNRLDALRKKINGPSKTLESPRRF